jgi:hypothetical protein
MAEIFGGNGVASSLLTELEKPAHPVVDPLLNHLSVHLLNKLLQSFRVGDIHKGVFLHSTGNPFPVQPKLEIVVAVEIKLALEGKIGRDLQRAGTAQQLIVEIDVVLLY